MKLESLGFLQPSFEVFCEVINANSLVATQS